MVDPPNLTGAPTERCQAQPAASRHGWRHDALCASAANSYVSFQGHPVAVCRIHLGTFERWGAQAEAMAIDLWDWPASGRGPDLRVATFGSHAIVGEARHIELTITQPAPPSTGT